MKEIRQDRDYPSISSTWKSYSPSFHSFLISSTYIDKNNPCFRWTNRLSKFGTFSHPSFINTSSDCCFLSQETREWVSVEISFKRNCWIFYVCPWFWSFTSWRMYPCIWTFRLWNSEQYGRWQKKVLQWHPFLLLSSFVTQTSLVQ